ncbi:hypothetical protein DOY81_011386 [Sarcophaga bullata]|nr:hypothetical protein DOY81_011386 [Sarcophaga bullata]
MSIHIVINSIWLPWRPCASTQVQQEQKFAKSSLTSSSLTSNATTTSTASQSAAAAASLVASTMANQMSAAASSYFSNNGHNLNDYDEHSLSSLSNGGDIDAVTEDEDDNKDPGDMHNIDVTSPSPQSPSLTSFGNGTGLKRKSTSNSSAYCDDALNNNNNNSSMPDERVGEYLSKSVVNGTNVAGFEGAVRPRSLEDMQKQNFMSLNGNQTMEHHQAAQHHTQKHLEEYNRIHQSSNHEQQDRLNDNDSLMNGSCASSEDLNQTNSSEQGEKITSGSDDEGQDDNCSKKKHRRNRTTFTTYQLHELERAFEKVSLIPMSIHAKS